MSKKKIAFLYSAAEYGGMLTNLGQINDALAWDQESLLITLEPQSSFIALPAADQTAERAYQFLGIEQKFSLAGLWRLVRLLRKHKISVLSSHGYKANFYAVLAARLVPKLSLVTVLHGWVGQTRRLKFYQQLDAYFLRFFQQIIILNQAQRALLPQAVSPEKVFLINNAVDVARLEYRLAQHLRQDDHLLTLSSVGRLSPEKSHCLVVEALAHLLSGHQTDLSDTAAEKIQLRIIGEGAERESLTNLISDKGLSKQVILTGFIPDICSELASTNVYVSASLFEGQPNAVLEAAAAALPLILSDIPEHKEMFTECPEVIFFKSDSAQDLARALEIVLHEETSAKLKVRGLKIKRYVSERYSLEAREARLREFYQRALEQC